MLKFEWISGDKSGNIDENKEVNINASIHKFQLSRGMVIPEDKPKTEPLSFKLDHLLKLFTDSHVNNEELKESLEEFRGTVEEINEKMERQETVIETLSKQISRHQELHEIIAHQQKLMEKLIDKLS